MLRALRAVPLGLVLLFSLFSFFTPATDVPPTVDIWDKLGHALIFAALALTGRLAGLAGPRLLAVLFGYGVLVEVLQGALPIGREGDWHDVVADSTGLVGGLVLAAVVDRAWRLLLSRSKGRDPAGAPTGRSRARRPG